MRQHDVHGGAGGAQDLAGQRPSFALVGVEQPLVAQRTSPTVSRPTPLRRENSLSTRSLISLSDSRSGRSGGGSVNTRQVSSGSAVTDSM
ncbi:hypothetical protein [Nonomuraea sp. NPDC050643]|uniref:hypothetical protein n=1 Tax=Nonomuraea sp. NPDC050643 TaxID=3155660 RepID=UPI0033E3BBFD